MTYTHHKWLTDVNQKIVSDYAKKQAEVTEPSEIQKTGHESEAIWINVLKNWLPPQYAVERRKYILFEQDGGKSSSGETDIIVFHPSYPEHLRSEHAVLAGGVAAAFSVKRTIGKSDVVEACNEAATLRRGLMIRKPTLRHELVPPIFYGLLAESHEWKSVESQPHKNVEKAILDYDTAEINSPREGLDLICVADLACWRRVTFALPMRLTSNALTNSRPDLRLASSVGSGIFNADQGAAQGLPFLSPLTRFIGSLWGKLALNDPGLEPVASGFQATEPLPHGNIGMKNWKLADVVSDDVMDKLEAGPTFGADWALGYM
jgi:hypothetical protein